MVLKPTIVAASGISAIKPLARPIQLLTPSHWQNMNQREVQAGQLYRSMETGLFGGPGREWKVISLAQRNDGVTYATLAMTHDPSEHKTLAMNVLQDRRMYRLVTDTPSDEPTIAPEP